MMPETSHDEQSSVRPYAVSQFTPAPGAVAQVLVSGGTTSILACGDGAVDGNGDYGTVYGYCYQAVSSIPPNPPAGAPSVVASGTRATWQLSSVPGATCGPAPKKVQTNYLAIWVTYPSSPQYSQHSLFYGACNGTSTDTCASGSGSFGEFACGAEQDQASIATTLTAKIFDKSGLFSALSEEVQLTWNPVRSQWIWNYDNLRIALSPAEGGIGHKLVVGRDRLETKGVLLASSGADESLHVIFRVATTDSDESGFTIDIVQPGA